MLFNVDICLTGRVQSYTMDLVFHNRRKNWLEKANIASYKPYVAERLLAGGTISHET